jgi:hypothetical protein
MAMPYEKGKVEGGPFCLQWISIIFKVNIQVWSCFTNSIVNFYFSSSNSDITFDVMSFETNASHIHYEPLLKEQCEHECIANCDHLTIRPNKKHRIDYHMVNEIPSAKSRSNAYYYLNMY